MNRWIYCGLLAATVGATSPADAALLVFSDRAAWRAAAGGSGDLFEDFNAFTQDVVYNPASNPNPVTAGFLTLSVVNIDCCSDPSYRIDAMPREYASLPDVNGTSFMLALTNTIGQISTGDTRVSFAPVKAIGFDYAGADYSTVNGDLVTSRGDVVTVAKSASGTSHFLGLLYTDGESFSSLTWTHGELSASFGSGIDDVEALSAVPVPPAGLLLLSGMLAARRIRRRRS